MNAFSYAVVTACLAVMAFMVLSTVVRLLVLDRGKRLEYIKDFKGQFVVVYLVALPLYIVGSLYTGATPWEAVLNSFSSIAELVILDFQIEPVKDLVAQNAFYAFSINSCFVLVACNAVLFAFSVFAQKMALHFRKTVTRIFRKRVLVVVGYNESNDKILASVDRKSTATMILCGENDEIMDYAYINKHAFATLTDDASAGKLIERLFGKMRNKKVNIIVNTGDDARNLVIVKSLTSLIESADLSSDEINRERGLAVWAFGEDENTEVFAHFVKKSKGRVHFINAPSLVAMDFNARYPITEFMTDEHIDYSTATVKEDIEPIVAMIGFGVTARKLFLTMVENNQLIYKSGDGLRQKKVRYFVYDKNASENDKNLNHTYFRYEREYGEGEREGYLPLPPVPASVSFVPSDINDGDFYEKLLSSLTVAEGKKEYGYIIVDYGKDMENLDIAEKLAEKLVEWKKTKSVRIFVNVSDGELYRTVATEYGKNAGFICYGDESSIVYSVDALMKERNERMAKDRHLCYALEDMENERKRATGKQAVAPPTDKKKRREWDKTRADERAKVLSKATEKWFVRWEQIQRDSNAYAIMSLRLKLHLLGYDYAPKENSEIALDWEDAVAKEFFAEYESGDKVNYENEDCFTEIGNKKTVDYGKCDFKKNTVRYNYAVLEHQRWNSYEIIHGYVPASIEEMLTLDKQTMIKSRKHANITTFDGLLEYRRIMARQQTAEKRKQTGDENAVVNEWETDVIKYDYQLLDDCVWLLNRNGFKFIKRK